MGMLSLFGKKGTVLGVDLGTSAIKLVQSKIAGNKIVIENQAIQNLQFEGNRTDRNDIPDSAYIDALRLALQESGITQKEACCSISGDSVIVRYLQFPDMEDEEMGYAVRLQAEEYVPFRLDEVYLDFYPLSPRTNDAGRKIDIILVAARKDQVDQKLNILRAVGLNPTIMDVDSFAMLNCLETIGLVPTQDVCALIDIGATYTNINILENGISRFSRDINMGGVLITQAIASRFSVSFQDAEKIKLSEDAVFNPDTAPAYVDTGVIAEVIKDTVEKITGETMDKDGKVMKITAAMRTPIQNIVTEIRRTLQFFENQSKSKPVSKALLVGGTAKLKNLDQYMSQRLGIPVELPDLTSHIDLSGLKSGHNDPGMLPSLVVGMGLSMRRLGDKKP